MIANNDKLEGEREGEEEEEERVKSGVCIVRWHVVTRPCRNAAFHPICKKQLCPQSCVTSAARNSSKLPTEEREREKMEGRKYFLCRNLTSALIFSFVTFVFCISSYVQYMSEIIIMMSVISIMVMMVIIHIHVKSVQKVTKRVLSWSFSWWYRQQFMSHSMNSY